MATLVFDIETIPHEWDSFDAYTKQRLIKSAGDGGEALAKQQLGLSPLTGNIISVTVFDIERRQGAVYFVGDGSFANDRVDDFLIKERTEKEILEDFWEGSRSYDVFVTFNGRAFDIPFLLHRSAINGVTPSVTFSQSRYLTKQHSPYHIDLMDELTMYGAMSKRPSLALLLQAYGVERRYPEVDGSQIGELFGAKKYREIIEHNIDDVLGTATLYERWKQHLAPASFLNAIEF